MKINRRMVLTLLCALLLMLVGCGTQADEKPEFQEEPEFQEKPELQDESEFLSQVEFSYMTDEETQELVREAMRTAGISDARQQVFFEHADQFYSAAGEYLTEGFRTAYISELPLYDPYALQDAWARAYPDLLGYNCRITAYSLMADFIQIDNSAEKRDEYLAFDLYALDADSSAFLSGQERDSFRVLFSAVPTDNTQDVDIHVKNIQKVWKERGISFENHSGISMISVFLHDKLDENGDELFIGHAGVLLEQPDGELLFVEKAAFQEPYQVTRLADRREVNDYLMGRYDISYGQETARPVIFENDKLLNGYRVNPNHSGSNVSLPTETMQETQGEDSEGISVFTGTLESKKDTMFIIVNESGEAYPVGFEQAPEGYGELKEGDRVVMEYTGKLSVVDSFTGEIISLRRTE